MKQVINKIIAVALIVSLSGCFGSFGLTKKVYEMNDSASDNGFVKSLLMVGLMIIPVYGVAVLADVLVLNTIEFWSGDNPVSMKDGEHQRQVFQHEGKTYTVDATQNLFKIRSSEDPSTQYTLRFDPESTKWFYSKNEGIEQVLVDYTGPGSSSFTVPVTGSDKVWTLSELEKGS
jgi:hypothetical protein